MTIESILTQLVKAIVDEARKEARREVLVATTPDEYLSTRAAANLADVTPGTIRDWCAQGKLKKHKAGRVIRVSRRELETLLRSGAANDQLSPEELAARRFG